MTIRLLAFRLLSLLALAVCMAMLVDSLRMTPAFCGFRAGCEEVVQSRYGRPLGVPLPLWGLVAFSLFFGLTLFPDEKTSRLLGPLAIVAGLLGATLVGIQFFVLHTTCPFCLMVDAAAILLAAVELGLPAAQDPPPAIRPRRGAWLSLAVMVLAAPVLWSAFKTSPEVPPQVQARWTRGRINVIEITDFACTYCRQTHPAIDQFLGRNGDQVHFVRLVAPLKRHANSRPAAKLYLCAVRQGMGEEMADALFNADDLSPDALRTLGARVGLDMTDYEACQNDPELDEELEETAGWVEAAKVGGLPQVWIQGVLLVGVQTPESLKAAWERAQRVEGN